MRLMPEKVGTPEEFKQFARRLVLLLWLFAMAGLAVSHLFTDPIPLGVLALVGLVSLLAMGIGYWIGVGRAERMLRRAAESRRQRGES